MRALIVVANFYPEIAQELVRGAEAYLQIEGVEFETLNVPGCLEIPAAIRFAIESKKYDAYIALGCVIRGETSHYDIVCNESARGLTWLGIEYQAAIGNGILTVEDDEQAMDRARVNEGNKGASAAKAALDLARLKQKFRA